MPLKEVLMGGGALILVLTLVQISPIRIDPWTALARCIGRALNGEVLEKLGALEKEQKKTKDRLDEHIRADDERDADMRRQRILRFNSDIMEGKNFTHEYFVDMLVEIDEYERYCDTHPLYKNNRAVIAISNIKRTFRNNEQTGNFRSP